MNAIIIIPARLDSTRLKRKLLKNLAGKSVLQRTFEQASRAENAIQILIATDSKEIANAVEDFGGEAVMTRSDHTSGTSRIAEAAAPLDAEIIVNIQGDEPEIDPAHIDGLIDLQLTAGAFASTLACPFPKGADPAAPSSVKAVLGSPIENIENGYLAADFSRTLPEFCASGGNKIYLHIGAYAFGRAALQQFANAPQSAREKIEKLEQLRILDMGEDIAVRIVSNAPPGIDTQADLDAAQARLSGDG